MKKLQTILTNIDYKLIGPADIGVNNLVLDSRQVGKGDLFAAQKGTASDGHDYIPQVIEKGASCILCEIVPENIPEGVTIIQTPDSHKALGQLASNFYDNPSSKFKLVGVTGTNGKTSIATLLHRLFQKQGYKAGLLSTVRNLIADREEPSTHTTPDSINLNRLMAEMVKEGCDYVFMEVSSHAIDQKRITGLEFDGAIFTNITHDHLDYHKTFDSYIKAKKGLFDSLSENAFSLVNLDDKRGLVMVQNTKSSVKTFSLLKPADYKGKILESHFDGTLLDINGTELWVKLIGKFNASNLLAVCGAATELGQKFDEVLQQLSCLETVDGRFEYVRSNTGVTAVVDYAHTPDALKNVIDTINGIREGSGQLITLVGAGGNRDKTKRPEMANIAAAGSDKVILTSDNPRFEEPQDILNDMMKGIEPHQNIKTLSIVDRKEAIRTACMLAKPGDIILIAGKGHETYQEVKGVRTHFNDKEIVSEFFMLNQINIQ
ncbi:MAG: UDP-N-acetylmuramoyl-L-alanyl-D-glutamate--2,6-diaminopimelate ligase [Bacteroidales bacterium]|nr:UDP-N-acetylmuramoyl-L-alanyl-D-glutamate--2,6-diaminopimelate ligase [Bacteroidales bacterium]MBN2817970.1 UDP-N-acetylmuramoyl-L-alanyl-D-glutamate--2,6-diaminopimelate ligase [Bacteroidales bacterium]